MIHTRLLTLDIKKDHFLIYTSIYGINGYGKCGDLLLLLLLHLC